VGATDASAAARHQDDLAGQGIFRHRALSPSFCE
jgi:hypothetical protein